jgi:hypothetical protein
MNNEVEELKLKVEELETELKEVLNVLLKVSPNHEGWVKTNWGYLYNNE